MTFLRKQAARLLFTRVLYSCMVGGPCLVFSLCLLLAPCLAFSPCFGQEPGAGTVFNITRYGAKGDGVTSDTKAINKAIAACVKAGGGTVFVPSGTFVTGSFRLFSNINLYLSQGAVLLGSPHSEDYLLQKDYGFTNYGAGNKLGIIFAVHAENVSVTGSGIVDGNPAASLYMDSLQISSDADWQYTRQGKGYMMTPGGGAGNAAATNGTGNAAATNGTGNAPAANGAGARTPAYDRSEAPVMWKGVYGDRPGVEITFYDCKKAVLKDFTIRNAADWSIALLGCNDAKVLGLSIKNNMSVPNSDGIDMYDSRNVIIADCDIRAGDDAIAVVSTSNLVVTNCNLFSRSSGIRVGYNGFNDDNSGNLLFDNIHIYGSNRGIGIFQRRKGNMTNMLFSNMIIDTRLYPGQWWGHGEPIHISALPGIGSREVGTISNVRFENIVATGEEGIVIYGSAESRLKDISLTNVQLTVTKGPLTESEGGNFDLRATNDAALGVFKHDIPALYAQYVSGLTVRHFDVRWGDGLPGFFTNAIDCNHFDGLTIEGLRGSTAAGSGPAVITLRDGNDVRIRDTRLTNPTERLFSQENVTGIDVLPAPSTGEAETHFNGYGAQAEPNQRAETRPAPATQLAPATHLASATHLAPAHFVSTNGIAFQLDGQPYYYIGANYWYGSLIAAGGAANNAGRSASATRTTDVGRERVREELDFLVSMGVTNLRILGAAEGAGMLKGRERVGPPLQPTEGKFDERVFRGMDYLLSEMGKRHMKAVIYLSNNWEWSGGFLQYLDWHGLVDDATVRAKMPYDEFRDDVSKFYSCKACADDYAVQCKALINRVNTFTHRRYVDDPAIMAWELGNEPRPMRPSSNEAYKQWVGAAAAYIKSLDPNHLVTVGTEGVASTENMQLYEDIHADKNVDYLTIHIWPKNFGFFSDTSIAKSWDNILGKAGDYIQKHVVIARRLNKPMVIEEFGLPRDLQSFVPGSPTTLRNAYYQFIFDNCAHIPVLAGCNFWAFGGMARPIPGQVFWKKGDTWMGDPPGEEQGLNTVFDCDRSTWALVKSWTDRVNTTQYKTKP